MSKSRFAVLGLGQFGQALATELARLGCEVLAVDQAAQKVEAVRDEVARAAVADIRDRDALRELFTSPFNVVVVAIGGALEAAIMATLHLKELGVQEVWAEATDSDRAEALAKVGATKVISPERDMGRRLAQRLAHPDLLESLPLTEGHSVFDMEAPLWTHGKTLAELDLHNTMNVTVIAIRRENGGVEVVPGGTAQLQPGDALTIVARDGDLARFRDRG